MTLSSDFIVRSYPDFRFCLVLAPNQQCYKTVTETQFVILTQGSLDGIEFSLSGNTLRIEYSNEIDTVITKITAPLLPMELMHLLSLTYEKMNEYKEALQTSNSMSANAFNNVMTPRKEEPGVVTPRKEVVRVVARETDDMFDSPEHPSMRKRATKQTTSNPIVGNPFTPKKFTTEISSITLSGIVAKIISSVVEKVEGAGMFKDEMTNDEYPDYTSIVQRNICLKDIHSVAAHCKYTSVAQFLTDVQQFVSNQEAYFGREENSEWKFALRTANAIKAFIMAHLEKELVAYGTSDVVLSEVVQRELERLGAEYKVFFNKKDLPDAHFCATYQTYDLPVRIESFMRSFYNLAIRGVTFTNQAQDLPQMQPVIDVRKFLTHHGMQDLVPLFFCEVTGSAVITYQRDSSSDFPVYILDMTPDADPSAQDGPYKISEFLRDTVRD